MSNYYTPTIQELNNDKGFRDSLKKVLDSDHFQIAFRSVKDQAPDQIVSKLFDQIAEGDNMIAANALRYAMCVGFHAGLDMLVSIGSTPPATSPDLPRLNDEDIDLPNPNVKTRRTKK